MDDTSILVQFLQLCLDILFPFTSFIFLGRSQEGLLLWLAPVLVEPLNVEPRLFRQRRPWGVLPYPPTPTITIGDASVMVTAPHSPFLGVWIQVFQLLWQCESFKHCTPGRQLCCKACLGHPSIMPSPFPCLAARFLGRNPEEPRLGCSNFLWDIFLLIQTARNGYWGTSCNTEKCLISPLIATGSLIVETTVAGISAPYACYNYQVILQKTNEKGFFYYSHQLTR